MKCIVIIILLTFIFTSTLSAEVTYPEFKKLTLIFHKEYDAELAAKKENFKVNQTAPGMDPDMWWNMPMIRAAYSSLTENGFKTHLLFLFGAYAKIPGMTIEGLANTLCHELGHGLGGAPYKVTTDSYSVSVEGQADYYSTKVCLKRILKYMPPNKNSQTSNGEDGYIDGKCKTYFTSKADIEMCLRSFGALESERIFFRIEENGKETFFDRPDQSIVTEINTAADFYPEAQCRLDTMVNGILGIDRPRCWYP